MNTSLETREHRPKSPTVINLDNRYFLHLVRKTIECSVFALQTTAQYINYLDRKPKVVISVDEQRNYLP